MAKAIVPRYDRTYELDIDAGDDLVNNVHFEGPDIHHVASPTMGASIETITSMSMMP